jgi:LruC domain-containing protein
LLILLVTFIVSCENSPFFNPWEKDRTLTSFSAPNDFDWTLTKNVDLTVDMILQGDDLESIEGQRVLLLDSAQQVLARGVITNNQARLYHGIPAEQSRMIVYFPLTGNYEYIYSWACLGTLPFEYGWDDPEEENGLTYLELINPEDPPSAPLKGMSMKSTVFGNSDFSQNELVETDGYWNNYETDLKWYVTTRNKGPASIENYNGNPALKLGQSNNRKVEVFQTVSWSTTGDFEVSLQAISPDEERIKVKLYLYFYDGNERKLRDRSRNYNIKDPDGWQTLSVSGEVPEGTEMIKFMIQDQGAKDPYYIDNITSTVIEDPDADDDGIPDREDEYPNDPDKAYNEYFPGEEEYGSLAFEDLWPAVGDYDFNDLVIDYNFNHIRNAQNNIIEVFGKFYLRAIGGSFHNGFGFELPVNQELVAEINGQELNEGIVELRSNGTETGSDQAVVMVFEDAWNYLRVFGVSFVNTRTEEEQTDPYLFELRIRFTTGLTDEEFGTPPYNPFIFVNGDRTREVHLHGYGPTDLADPELFGTGEDFSNPQTNSYYRTATNLPWALNIPSSFEYPEEKNPVDEAYLKFIEWAETSGSSKNDWYKLKDGYRNSDKIFRRR